MTIFSRLTIAIIHIYQWCISPWLGVRCRFEPTCSHYGIEAIQNHGLSKGGLLTIKRLLRCHPFGGMGYDPVPGNYKIPQLNQMDQKDFHA